MYLRIIRAGVLVFLSVVMGILSCSKDDSVVVPGNLTQTEIETNNQELKFLNHRLKSGESVITKAYDQLRTRNKQIKNNIRAALTIQQAMLPPTGLIRQLLPEHFIIYLPKLSISCVCRYKILKSLLLLCW